MCCKPIIYNNMLVPCRQCHECRQKRADDWAVRCVLEAKKHENNNCMVTLTYNDDYNPVVLQPQHLQLFIKRLRKSIFPAKIKYFACGEYGTQRFRPHYHILFFGYRPIDLVFFNKSKSGYSNYTSAALSKLWLYGFSSVSNLTYETAQYCSLYCSLPVHKLPQHLQQQPEFNRMSQGLGYDEMEKNFDTFFETDEIFANGKKHSMPKYFMRKKYGIDKFNKDLKEADLHYSFSDKIEKQIYHPDYCTFIKRRLDYVEPLEIGHTGTILKNCSKMTKDYVNYNVKIGGKTYYEKFNSRQNRLKDYKKSLTL